jgi:hypothetical protein
MPGNCPLEFPFKPEGTSRLRNAAFALFSIAVQPSTPLFSQKLPTEHESSTCYSNLPVPTSFTSVFQDASLGFPILAIRATTTGTPLSATISFLPSRSAFFMGASPKPRPRCARVQILWIFTMEVKVEEHRYFVAFAGRKEGERDRRECSEPWL